MPGYRLSLLARQDLISIWKYIAAEDRIAASRVVRGFNETFQMLTRQPLIGESRNELKAELRCLTQGRYVIFYRH